MAEAREETAVDKKAAKKAEKTRKKEEKKLAKLNRTIWRWKKRLPEVRWRFSL